MIEDYLNVCLDLVSEVNRSFSTTRAHKFSRMCAKVNKLNLELDRVH